MIPTLSLPTAPKIARYLEREHRGKQDSSVEG
jgi:hypothetical protein